MKLKGRKIAVLGLGREGRALADYFKSEGIKADFLDEDPRASRVGFPAARTRTGASAFDALKSYDLVFRSPGIRPHHSKLAGLGRKLTSLTRLFFELWPGSIIGVTGTKGKGTTASLIKTILDRNATTALLVGNIGSVTLTDIKKYDRESTCVVELSSFQLMDLGMSPHIAVALDVTADHLDYHKDLREYHDAKLEIARHQSARDWLITTFSNPLKDRFIREASSQAVVVDTVPRGSQKGVWWRGGNLNVQWDNIEEAVVSRDEIRLLGKHNLTNVAAATAAALAAGIPIEPIRSGLRSFHGNALRLETLGTYKGVSFINDGAATNPCATLAAIAVMQSPFILLIGGRNKGMDYSQLRQTLKTNHHLKAAITFGELGGELMSALARDKIPFHYVKPCQEAIRFALELARRGDTVLLSPAAASQDEFKNYQARGQLFNNLVYEYRTR